jgi:ankyrin repeat protein
MAVLKLRGLRVRHLPDLFPQVPEMKIDATDIWGMTALNWAAQINDPEAVYTLLYLGADPNKADGRFYTPLMRTTDPQCMEILLDEGAFIDSRDNLHQTALFPATQSPRCVRTLLKRGASIDLTERSHGLTAAHFCASNNRADSLRVLLQHGADFRVRAVDGNNLLHTAAKISDGRTLEVLVEAAEAGIVWDTHDRNDEGATFRMLAERRMKSDTIIGGKLQQLLAAVDANDFSYLPTA